MEFLELITRFGSFSQGFVAFVGNDARELHFFYCNNSRYEKNISYDE